MIDDIIELLEKWERLPLAFVTLENLEALDMSRKIEEMQNYAEAEVTNIEVVKYEDDDN